MKCCGLSLLLFGVLSVGPLAFGQDDAEQNVHYERLKVLEPIIGTWYSAMPNRQTGGQIEQRTTYRWIATKRMIIADSVRREIADGEPGPWTEGGPRFHLVWNQKLECIEIYSFATLAGWAFVERVLPKGDNEFELISTQVTVDRGTANMTMTISDEEILWKLRNRKSVDGEALDDQEVILKRVHPDAQDTPEGT